MLSTGQARTSYIFLHFCLQDFRLHAICSLKGQWSGLCVLSQCNVGLFKNIFQSFSWFCNTILDFCSQPHSGVDRSCQRSMWLPPQSVSQKHLSEAPSGGIQEKLQIWNLIWKRLTCMFWDKILKTKNYKELKQSNQTDEVFEEMMIYKYPVQLVSSLIILWLNPGPCQVIPHLHLL